MRDSTVRLRIINQQKLTGAWGWPKKTTSPSKPSCPASERTPHTHLIGKHIPNFTGFAYGNEKFQWKKQELTFLIDYHMTDDGSIDIFDGFIDDVFHQNHSEPSNLDGICHSPGVGDGSLGYLGYPHGKQMVNLNLPGVSSWNPKQILKAFMLG